MGLIALLFSVLLDAIRPLRGRARNTRYGEEDDEGFESDVADPLDPFDPLDPLDDAPFDHLPDAAAGLSPDPAAGLAGLAGAPPEPAPRQSSTGAGRRPVPGSAAAAAAGAGAGSTHPLQRYALRLIDWMSSDAAGTDAGADGSLGRPLSAAGWVAVVGIPVVLVALAQAVLGVLGGFFVFLLHVFVLYLTVGLGGFHRRFMELQLLIGAGEERAARSVLQRWIAAGGAIRTGIGETARDRAAAMGFAPAAGASVTSRLARPATAQAVLAAYRDVFAPLFWYALLPGAIGPVLYLFARFAACHSYPFARTTYYWIDWIPLRLASIGLALAGQFEDAVFCLRAVSGIRAAPGAAPDPFLHQRVVLLPVAGGALGLRLNDPAVDAVLRTHAPDLDLPEADPEPLSLRPAASLLLRSSVLWVGLYLLVKVLD